MLFPFSTNYLIWTREENSSMEEERISSFQFPPGFRFHPSDEELIIHYLLNKVHGRPLPASVIAEIELYSFNPWELPKKALFGEDEWYFFSPRDRKYPNGERPNRTAASGFWKATGTDKPILSSVSRRIGVKKSLVFYTGRPPNGCKTEWIMNEYRLPETRSRSAKLKGSMRLDDWVLCRVRKKGNMSKNVLEVKDAPCKPAAYQLPQMKELPSHGANTDIMADRLFKDFQVMASILAGQELPPLETNSSGPFQARKNRNNNGFVYDFDSGNKYSNVLRSTKMVTEDNKCKDFLPGSILISDDTHFYCDRFQGDIFNLHHSGAVINLAELNDLLS